jgi:M6 family metalloprotease-like protein
MIFNYLFVNLQNLNLSFLAILNFTLLIINYISTCFNNKMKNRVLFFIALLLFLVLVASSINQQRNDFVPTKIIKSVSTSTGKIEALVVLIEFADRDAFFTRDEVDSFFNQVGYTKYHDNGSIHDYWAAVSQGRVNVHTNVSAAYYRAPKPFAYYDTDGGSGHCDELLDSALNWLDKRGFDFSTLTVDINKNIKGLSFQFVGNSGANGLWGHSSSHGRTFDGVNTASYEISELGTTEMHPGGICHEQGHMLFGWPDTYDTDSSNGGSNGCGKYDLMAGGNSDNSGAPSGNPMPPNPYFRFLAGWNDMILLNGFPNDTILKVIANSWNTYVYRNPYRAGEMYIMEARKKPFRNVDMPGEGILIWHIDSVIPNNANQQHTELQHYKVAVVQADKLYQLETGVNTGDSFDYYKAGSTSSLTYPFSCWWNTACSGFQFRNAGAVSDTMLVTFGSTSATDVGITSIRSSGGNVSPLGLKYYTQNTSQSYQATPLKGFEVTDCLVDGVSQGALSNYTFTGLSAPHTISFTFTDKAVILKDILNVIDYSYYEGAWNSMPDFSKLTAIKTGTISTLSLAIPGRTDDFFGIRFSGYIKAPADGEYKFYMTADDGARFLIDGVQIVANQCQPETTGTILLRAGYHSFSLDFFEIQVTESVSLKWSSTGFTKRIVTGLVKGTIDANTGVADISTNNESKMNTTSGEFIFNCPGESTINVEVYNMNGMLIEKQTLYLIDGLAKMSNTNLTTGLYCIRVNAGNNTIIRQKTIINR